MVIKKKKAKRLGIIAQACNPRYSKGFHLLRWVSQGRAKG
jgi:hypothetical protein